MGRNCILMNCRSAQAGHPKVSLFCFPKANEEPERRKKWIAFVARLGVDQTEVDERVGPCLCIHHFTPDSFKVISSKSVLKKGALPTIPALITAENARFESLFILEPPTEDIDAKLKVELLSTLRYFTSRNKMWDCTEIDDGFYLYKLALEPFRIVAALKFVGSSVQMQYDGVTLSKSFIEKVLGKIFPLTIEGLPELIQYFEILNIEEFRNQRPDVGFNFDTNVRNKTLDPDTCRICFQPTKKPLSDGTRKIFRDITNQVLAPNICLPDKCCAGCTNLIKTTKHNKDFLISCSDLLIKYAKSAAVSMKEEVEVVIEEEEVKEDIEDESKMIPKVELQAEYLDEDFLEEYENLVEDFGTTKRHLDEEEEEFEPPKKKPSRKDWLKEEGYSITVDKNGKERYECTKCNSSFTSEKYLQNHIRRSVAHGAIKAPALCSICNEQFNSAANLVRHTQQIHDKIQLTCDFCGKQYNRHYMISHMKTTHMSIATVRKHTCASCGKGFRENFILQNHIRKMHTESKPFQCEFCHESFSVNKEMLRHRRDKHPEAAATYLCNICSFSTMSKQGLNLHLKSCSTDRLKEKLPSSGRNARGVISSLPRIFACSFCSKKFSTKKRLDEHEARHKQNKLEFYCPTCNEAFSRADVLRLHEINMHTKEFRYFCPHCNKGFSSQGVLNAHVKFHTKLDALFCQYCKHSFVKLSELQKHVNSVHKKMRYQCKFCPNKTPEFKFKPLFLHHMQKYHLQEIENPDFNEKDYVIMNDIG